MNLRKFLVDVTVDSNAHDTCKRTKSLCQLGDKQAQEIEPLGIEPIKLTD